MSEDDGEYHGPGQAPEHGGRHTTKELPDDPGLDLLLSYEALADLGNARRLIQRHGTDLIYTPEREWGAWDGARWNFQEGKKLIQLRSHETADAMRGEVKALTAHNGKVTEGVKALEAFARQSMNSGRLKAMRDVSAPYLQHALDEFDARPELLNVENGTLKMGYPGGDGDLVSVKPHARGDMLTRRAPVAFDPKAEAPQFRQFVERILPDPAVRKFVQTYIGYAATGDSGAQLLVCFYGRGANGKSVLLNIARGVLGDYCMTLPFASMTDDRPRGGGEPTPDLVRLPGARLVMASEPRVGTRLSESTIKALTGGEPIMVRPLFLPPFEFVPTHSIILSFNNKPKIFAQDEGTWRRIALVLFPVTIPKAERDELLAQTIIAEEAPGVLNWILDGVRMYRDAGGLIVPEEVRTATQAYRDDSDPIGPFITSACVERPGYTILASDLFKAYVIWAERNAVDPVSRRRFGLILTEKSWERSKGSLVSYRDWQLSDEYASILAGSESRNDRPYADDGAADEPPI